MGEVGQGTGWTWGWDIDMHGNLKEVGGGEERRGGGGGRDEGSAWWRRWYGVVRASIGQRDDVECVSEVDKVQSVSTPTTCTVRLCQCVGGLGQYRNRPASETHTSRCSQRLSGIAQASAHVRPRSDVAHDGSWLRSRRCDSRGCGLRAALRTSHKVEIADQSLITDLLLFVWHHRPPTTLVLISNDPHFSPILTRVRDLGYRVVLIHSQDEVRDALRRSADIALHLKRDVLQLTQQQLQADEKQEQVEGVSHTTPGNDSLTSSFAARAPVELEQRELAAEQELKNVPQTQSTVKDEPLSVQSAAPSVTVNNSAAGGSGSCPAGRSLRTTRRRRDTPPPCCSLCRWQLH